MLNFLKEGFSWAAALAVDYPVLSDSLNFFEGFSRAAALADCASSTLLVLVITCVVLLPLGKVGFPDGSDEVPLRISLAEALEQPPKLPIILPSYGNRVVVHQGCFGRPKNTRW